MLNETVGLNCLIPDITDLFRKRNSILDMSDIKSEYVFKLSLIY